MKRGFESLPYSLQLNGSVIQQLECPALNREAVSATLTRSTRTRSDVTRDVGNDRHTLL